MTAAFVGAFMLALMFPVYEMGRRRGLLEARQVERALRQVDHPSVLQARTRNRSVRSTHAWAPAPTMPATMHTEVVEINFLRPHHPHAKAVDND
jgi:hypothetical protein